VDLLGQGLGEVHDLDAGELSASDFAVSRARVQMLRRAVPIAISEDPGNSSDRDEDTLGACLEFGFVDERERLLAHLVYHDSLARESSALLVAGPRIGEQRAQREPGACASRHGRRVRRTSSRSAASSQENRSGIALSRCRG
jgi:hypothetical protein